RVQPVGGGGDHRGGPRHLRVRRQPGRRRAGDVGDVRLRDRVVRLQRRAGQHRRLRGRRRGDAGRRDAPGDAGGLLPAGPPRPAPRGRRGVVLARPAVRALVGPSVFLAIRREPATSYVNPQVSAPVAAPANAPAVVFHVAGASFVRLDTATQGNWVGAYGAD